MTNDERMVLAVMDGLERVKRGWRVFKTEGKGRKYAFESVDLAERRVRLKGSGVYAGRMWMGTTLASLAED